MLALTSFSLAFTSFEPSKVHEERAAQIKTIEETPNVLWRAAAHPRFAHAAPGASASMNGVKGDWGAEIRQSVLEGSIKNFVPTSNAAVPDAFDSETAFPQCAKIIGEIRDQSNCGCCWAFAGAEAASDRLCISTNASMQVSLSAQDVCFCSSFNGCGGGQISTPWHYIKNKGAVTGGVYKGDYTGQPDHSFTGMCSDFSLPHCHHHGPTGDDPYPAEGAAGCPSEQSASCPSSCDASASSGHSDFSSDKISFKGKGGFDSGIETASGETKIQQMIMAGGPVETAFTVYSDFENYAGGIYHHVSGGMAGGHAVKFVGWGVDGGVKYWKVANSWNPYWGEKGYFRIMRGTNEGGIEDQVIGTSATATWGKKDALA
jgi:cathepsin B